VVWVISHGTGTPEPPITLGKYARNKRVPRNRLRFNSAAEARRLGYRLKLVEATTFELL
jgi:hypothetical protein